MLRRQMIQRLMKKKTFKCPKKVNRKQFDKQTSKVRIVDYGKRYTKKEQRDSQIAHKWEFFLQKWKKIYDFSENKKIKTTMRPQNPPIRLKNFSLVDHLSNTSPSEFTHIKFDNAFQQKFMCDYCINQVNLYTQADPKAKAIGFPECACQNNYQCTVRNIHNYLISKGMKKEVLTEQ